MAEISLEEVEYIHLERIRIVNLLAETKGISNHFWRESVYRNKNGEIKLLTEARKDWYLDELTEIKNLEQLNHNWPYIDWRQIVSRSCKISKLQAYLEEVCFYKERKASNSNRQLERVLLTTKIPIYNLVTPYLLQGERQGFILGRGRDHRLIGFPEINVYAETRSVNWESRILYTTNERGEIVPQQFAAVTLKNLVVHIDADNDRPSNIQG